MGEDSPFVSANEISVSVSPVSIIHRELTTAEALPSCRENSPASVFGFSLLNISALWRLNSEKQRQERRTQSFLSLFLLIEVDASKYKGRGTLEERFS